MSMVSYAQNHEDVLLARALADTTTGFYIDVGALDPTVDSVTRHFYDLGWHGINIEPQAASAAKLREARPRDLTLGVALSDYRGTATLYSLTQGDAVATIDEARIHRLQDAGMIVAEVEVPVETLAGVCAKHCDPQTPISFLKIDVEGHERAVLSGCDWSQWRPRILAVEATEPMTSQPSHEMWEPLLLSAGYVFAQFDGINRWYAPQDETRIIELLSVPVNALDAYAPYYWVARVAELEAQVASLAAQLAAGSAEPPPNKGLIASLESLEERFRHLSEMLEEERTLRAVESERIATLAHAVAQLSDGSAG